MRPIERGGSWGAKAHKINDKKIPAVDWNERTKAEVWREGWADAINSEFERLGIPERVDHRSYERQGIEKIPTIHMGVAATQMERKGIVTERGDINREIAVKNGLLRQIWERLKQLKDWLKEALSTPAKPTLADTIQWVLDGGRERNCYINIVDLRMVPQVLGFMQEHNISTLPELRRKAFELNTWDAQKIWLAAHNIVRGVSKAQQRNEQKQRGANTRELER
jgi:hypothetical protein